MMRGRVWAATFLAPSLLLFDTDLARGAFGDARERVERIAASFGAHLGQALVQLLLIDAAGAFARVQVFLPVVLNAGEAVLRRRIGFVVADVATLLFTFAAGVSELLGGRAGARGG